MDIYEGIFECAPDAMLVVGGDGIIAKANQTAERMFGYERGALAGASVESLIPRRFTSRHVQHRSEYFSEPRTRPMGEGLDLFGLRNDGTEFPVDIMLSPMKTESGPVILCVARDCTDRKRAESLILESLREKEVLIKEIHHRVKNNLAVMSSLFYLQSTYTHDEPTIEILRESQDRVRSMALVHESLYQSGNFSAVNFADYAVNLSEQLIGAYTMPTGRIKLISNVESVQLNMELAVPCGLILNEIVTNALKHAFPHGYPGEIQLNLRTLDTGDIELCVIDNGVGITDMFDPDASPTLGLRLIRLLARQIDGDFRMSARLPGTEVCLKVPALHG
ncbi:MAG: PAS domain S-box protein [Candidatus Hydrogenedens sp.]|nr:PAS domain S-box protein [Candidatus Hydrogenedens sp.]